MINLIVNHVNPNKMRKKGFFNKKKNKTLSIFLFFNIIKKLKKKV